jgi:hypothetical protein
VRKNLLSYRYNRYSQSGEDGIIEELCRRLGIITGWFVEFGAWDGKHPSNTYNLLSHHAWQGAHIEGNPERYQGLLLTQAAFPKRLHTLCAMVGFEGENKLDKLLAARPCRAILICSPSTLIRMTGRSGMRSRNTGQNCHHRKQQRTAARRLPDAQSSHQHRSQLFLAAGTGAE